MQTRFKLSTGIPPEIEIVLKSWISCQRLIRNTKVQVDRYHRSFVRSALARANKLASACQQHNQLKTDLTLWFKRLSYQLPYNDPDRLILPYRCCRKIHSGCKGLKRKYNLQLMREFRGLFRFMDPESLTKDCKYLANEVNFTTVATW